MGLDLHLDEVMFWLLPRPVRVICDYYSSSLAARGFCFLGFLFGISTKVSWEPFGIQVEVFSFWVSFLEFGLRFRGSPSVFCVLSCVETICYHWTLAVSWPCYFYCILAILWPFLLFWMSISDWFSKVRLYFVCLFWPWMLKWAFREFVSCSMIWIY